MPLFAAGAGSSPPDSSEQKQYVGQIDPSTMLSIMRLKSEKEAEKPFFPEPVSVNEDDPTAKTKKKKSKKSKKNKEKDINNAIKRRPGEVETRKGVYFLDQSPAGSLFCLDKKGDTENRIFQRIYNGELPVYKRINRDIIGLEHFMFNDKKKSKKKKKNEIARYFDKKNRKLIKAAPAATARSMKNKNRAMEDVDSQKAQLTMYTTELIEDFNEDNEIEILQLRTRDFNRQLQENPEDVSLWLDFVEFQDELFEDQIEKAQNGKNISRKVLNEKKIAILDRALDVNQKSVRLRVALLHFGKKIWPQEELQKRWEGLVFSNPHLPELWRAFLDSQFNTPLKAKMKYYQKQFETLGAISEGSYATTPPENLEDEMIINLNHLTAQLSHLGQTEKATAIFQAMIEVNYFCPPALRMRNRENKLKAAEHYWESNLPRCGEASHVSWAEYFITAGAKRFTEEHTDELDENELKMINQDEAAGLSWARVEVYRDRRQWLPLRSLEDDDDLDDQERRIKFSDIRNSLFCLPDDQLCIRLLFSFLRYLGAPTLFDSVPGDIVSDEFFQRQILTHGQLIYSPQAASVPKNIAEALNSLQDCRFYQPLPPACGQTYDVDRRLGTCPKMNHQFISRLLQQILEKAEVSGALHDPDAKLSFATNGIYYFRSRLFFLKQGGVQISRSHKDYKEGKKFAKAVLKRPELRGNVIPWCEFGRLEAEAAGASAAVNEIFTNCLALGHSLRAKADDFKVFACMFYVLKEMAMVILFASDMAEYPALARAFISAVGTFLANEEAPSLGATFEPVNLLRIRNELIDLLGKHAAAYRDDIYAYYGWSWGESAFFDVAVVVSAFELAVGDVTSSVAALENVIETMQTSLEPHIQHYDPTVVDEPTIRRRRKDLHSIHLFRIQLFAKFATREQSLTKNLIQFRQFISSALLDFPSSVELLYIWYHVESMKLGIHRPSDNLNSTGSVLARQIFSILYDLSREARISNLNTSSTPDADSSNTAKVMTTGLHHRIRKKFSSAVQKYPQCALLWRMYLAFEKKMENEVEYENVFYRAIDHLPHVKCLYIDAIIYMPYRIDEYLRTMSDRDVRLRVPIEEIRMLLNIPVEEAAQPTPVAQDIKQMPINDDEEDPDVEEIPIVIKEDRARRSNSRELSPDRMDDVASSGEDEEEYESVPAYEAPHKRTDEEDRKRKSSRKRPKGVQYPDPEFDRRWEKKRRDAEDAKEKEIEERRRRREDERRERYRSNDDYSDDDGRDFRSRSRSRSWSRDKDYRRSISPARQRDRRSPSYEKSSRDRRRDSRDRDNDYERNRSSQYSRGRLRSLSRERREPRRSPSYERESRRSPKRSKRSVSNERKSRRSASPANYRNRRSRSNERSSRKNTVKYDFDSSERYDPARPTRSPARDDKRRDKERRRTRSRSPEASSRYYSSRR